ncbi:energy transducer TonB [Flaviaesturariibacter flavus]|uniref:energy transducer TonB n=1 Tax=Flaviaesturariibacter flavus TaxID=2502780 RepID=UPI0014045C94|nr:energy transducer TonB [Flaviaesturariibacter flavus]
MRKLILSLSVLFLATLTRAQGDGAAVVRPESLSFITYQKTLSRPSDAMRHKIDTLQKQFAAKGLEWPAKNIYIRSFKYDSQLEVWVKGEKKEPFKLFKTYRVCAMAGALGPKRMQGDYQVPEGFYFINEFNPNSQFHLSLGLNYPNASDRILSDSLQPGGDIYIHGSCVTTGCIPLTDTYIEELYVLAAFARDAGQEFIPVHIFPVRYSNKKSAEYLKSLTKTDNELKVFAENLERVYDHFEATKSLPVIMTNSRGEYLYANLSKKAVPAPPVKKVHPARRMRNVTAVADVVHEWPKFPGGNSEFLDYLKKVGHVLADDLPATQKKAYVQVEFVVDADGTPVNFKVVKGVNADFNEEIITRLEKMPYWQPALLDGKPVAKRIVQGFAIEPDPESGKN